MEVSQTRHCCHYNNKQQILLVGEGDFSFSLCLARAFGSATNITATSLDTRDELVMKYTNAKQNVEELERLGCTVVHGVNVHSMSRDIRVYSVYDRIIFNFPHAGFLHFGRESDTYTISQHQQVVRGFLSSAKDMVRLDGGEIHVTHKTAHPFSSWNIRGLGSEIGLICDDEKDFDSCQYPGYSNKRGSGSDPNSSFPVGKSSTFMFKRYLSGWK